MTAFSSIKQSLAADIARLNQVIRANLLSGNPLMDTVIEQYLTTKGKQIRPIIVMLCARIFQPQIDDKVLNAAAAVELLHNASLIHDDVVDEAKLRRNHPTVNAVWDNHIAVLVGDFFVSTALQRALDTADLRIVQAIGNLGKLLSLGEIDQIYNARQHTLTEESYFKVINFKTASLFVACAQVGCYAVGADADATAKLERVAELLGLCFQIRDDIFDYYDADTVGKPTGNDLREGKVTLPLLHVLRRADLPQAADMLKMVQADQLTEDQISTLIAFARDNGGVEYAYERMAELRAEAADILASLQRHHLATNPLLTIFDYIIARDF